MAAKSKPAPWNSFTKAELIRTIKTLSARETKHLNRIVALVDGLDEPEPERPLNPNGPFPWEQS